MESVLTRLGLFTETAARLGLFTKTPARLGLFAKTRALHFFQSQCLNSEAMPLEDAMQMPNKCAQNTSGNYSAACFGPLQTIPKEQQINTYFDKTVIPSVSHIKASRSPHIQTCTYQKVLKHLESTVVGLVVALGVSLS